MNTAYICRKCHQPRQANQVVELTNIRDGHLSFLCRPSSDQRCFANDVYAASEERVAAVDDDPGGAS